MKNKNPLYVVKGKDVFEANSVFDLVVKKLNLEPMVQIIQNILKMLLEQIQSYPMLKFVEAYMAEVISKVMALGKNFGLA